MEAFIARQPIFDRKRRVAGYELLYRDGAHEHRAVFADGDRATSHLLSDAIIQFGLPRLTDHKPAYVNFTANLILNGFVLLTKPEEVVVELLENIQFTDEILEKLRALKHHGYILALDDYIGGEIYDRVLPLIDILKVDFRLTSEEKRKSIVQRVKLYRGLKLLAEKVETQEEFVWAAKAGYELFQGYFFEKPLITRKKIPPLAGASYGRILKEMQSPDINITRCAQIVYSDPVLTYHVLRRIRRLEYYRGNIIKAIQQALVMMGTNELRRLLFLLLARENNVTQCDELVKKSFLRGIFAEELVGCCRDMGEAYQEDGFFLGMFSLMDKIMGVGMEEAIKDLGLHQDICDALLGRAENKYTQVLLYITIYELGNPKLILPEIGTCLSSKQTMRLYMRCLEHSDRVFGAFDEGMPR